jgi:hypothetical protein
MPSSDTRGCWIRAISRKTSSSSGSPNNWAKCRCFSAAARAHLLGATAGRANQRTVRAGQPPEESTGTNRPAAFSACPRAHRERGAAGVHHRRPEAGVATAVLAEVGHSVDARLPLLLIVPTDSHLEAELYVPSRAMGFVQPGDPVNVRYQAYPYQKIRIYRGELVSVSRTSISPLELSSPANVFQGAGEAREPLYRLRVRLIARLSPIRQAASASEWHAAGGRHSSEPRRSTSGCLIRCTAWLAG